MSDLIRMTHPDRDFHCDVHPDEVDNYRKGGWNVDDSEPQSSSPDMTVAELKDALKAKEIEFPATAKKAELQALLAASEENGAE